MSQQEKKPRPRYGIMSSPQTINRKKGELLLNMITQEAKKRQSVVKLAMRYLKQQEWNYSDTADLFLTYHDNGNIKSSAYFRAGFAHGTAQLFARDGSVTEKNEFKNGKIYKDLC